MKITAKVLPIQECVLNMLRAGAEAYFVRETFGVDLTKALNKKDADKYPIYILDRKLEGIISQAKANMQQDKFTDEDFNWWMDVFKTSHNKYPELMTGALHKFYFTKQALDTIETIKQYKLPNGEAGGMEIPGDLMAMLKSHDWYAGFSDSATVQNNSDIHEKRILDYIGDNDELREVALAYGKSQGEYAGYNFLQKKLW